MSPIIGVFGRNQELHRSARALTPATASASARSAPFSGALAATNATLGLVARDARPGAPASGSLVDDGRFVVAADASFYYLRDLERAMGEQLARDASPAAIALAAYRRFGKRCTERLEGDYAFVIWDRVEQVVFCARDFAGRRPLHLAERDGALVVASHLVGIAALAPSSVEVDDVSVGADAAGFFYALDDTTCMRGARAVRAGWIATWSEAAGLETHRVWEPSAGYGGRLDFEDAALHLRDLLADAVAQRMATDGPTVVWMSGGRDSTAVFGAGMHALRQRGGDPAALIPVSRSHPQGDSGREDEAIDAVARMWGVRPRWIDAPSIPMLTGIGDDGSWRRDSFAQPFENLTRALARAGRAEGATIALDGFGGDFLFQVSREYLADLVARGQLATAIREWRRIDRGREGWRGFVRAALVPRAPAWALRAAAMARGGTPLRRAIERVAPPWISREFLDAHAIEARAFAQGPYGQPGATQAERETRFYLTHQFFARVNATMGRFAREEGVEIRSPVMDARVIAFALSRPRDERNLAGDQKRLLRAAMRGLLPDEILAPRPHKTGTLATYFRNNMRQDGLARLQAIGPAPLLAVRGIVDGERFAQEVRHYAAAGAGYEHEEALYCTMMAELWLRAHTAAGRRDAACA